jgi:cytochrome P450
MQAQGTTGWQLAAHANALIIAGSETTGTVLSGLFYYTLCDPRIYSKLKTEIRSAFTSVDQITSRAATDMRYLTAVINEAFRIYPPIPIGMPRVASTDQSVSGHLVPAGTTVSVHMWSVTHNPANFREPFRFMPERWLDNSQADVLEASQPFLVGTRSCMGRNMAWIELRILITKLVWLFDFELIPGQSNWESKNKCFILWEKPGLWVRATPRLDIG